MNDRTEALSKELKELEQTMPGIRTRRKAFLEDPEVHKLLMTVIAAERFSEANEIDGRTLSKLDEKKELFNKEFRLFREKRKAISKELVALTQPVIQKTVKDLYKRIEELKLEREIISKRYHGPSKTTILKIHTNQTAVFAVRNKILEKIAEVQTWVLKPISEINAEMKLFYDEIRGYDLSKKEEKELSENEFYKGKVPQGIAIDKNYSGPRAGF